MSARNSDRSEAVEEQIYDLVRYIRPLHRSLALAVEEKLEGTGVTVAMRAVLERLHDGGPQSVPQISRALFIGRQFIQRLCNELLAQGYIDKRSNPAHRRSQLMVLRQPGHDLFVQIRQKENEELRLLAQQFSAPDIAACGRVLAAMSMHFRAEGENGTQEDWRPFK